MPDIIPQDGYKVLSEGLRMSSGRNNISAVEVLLVTTAGDSNPYDAVRYVKEQFQINEQAHHDTSWYDFEAVGPIYVSGHQYIRRVTRQSYRVAVLYSFSRRRFGNWIRLRRWRTGGSIDPTFNVKAINRTGARTDGTHVGDPVFAFDNLRFRRFNNWRYEYHLISLDRQSDVSAAIQNWRGHMFWFGADADDSTGWYLLSDVSTIGTDNGLLQVVWKFHAGSAVPGYDGNGDVGSEIPALGQLDEYTVMNVTDPNMPKYETWHAEDIYGPAQKPDNQLNLPGNW